MKTFIIILIVIAFLAIGGVVVYYIFKNNTKNSGPVTVANFPVQTLQGELEPAQFNGEYKDVVINGNKTTGVTSNTLNLTPYEGRNVKIVGQYSGNTMYADSISVIQ